MMSQLTKAWVQFECLVTSLRSPNFTPYNTNTERLSTVVAATHYRVAKYITLLSAYHSNYESALREEEWKMRS